MLALMAAIFGIIGTVIGAGIQGFFNLELKEMESESNLILKAVETGDLEKAKRNLEFFLVAELITDKRGKIRSAIEAGLAPVLPVSSDRTVKLNDMIAAREQILNNIESMNDFLVRNGGELNSNEIQSIMGTVRILYEASIRLNEIIASDMQLNEVESSIVKSFKLTNDIYTNSQEVKGIMKITTNVTNLAAAIMSGNPANIISESAELQSVANKLSTREK